MANQSSLSSNISVATSKRGRHTIRFVGYAAVIMRLLCWNIYFLLTISILVLLVLSDQGGQLLKIIRENSGEIDLRLYLPLFGNIFLLSLGSGALAVAGDRQIIEIARRHGISKAWARHTATLVVPMLLAATPSSLISYEYRDSALWLFSLSVLALAAAIARALEKSCILQIPPRSRRESLTMLTAILLALACVSFALCLCVLTGSSFDWARRMGALGIAVLAIPLWAFGLSLVFIALTIRFKCCSLAFIPPPDLGVICMVLRPKCLSS